MRGYVDERLVDQPFGPRDGIGFPAACEPLIGIDHLVRSFSRGKLWPVTAMRSMREDRPAGRHAPEKQEISAITGKKMASAIAAPRYPSAATDWHRTHKMAAPLDFHDDGCMPVALVTVAPIGPH